MMGEDGKLLGCWEGETGRKTGTSSRLSRLAIMMMEWWPLAPKNRRRAGAQAGGTSDSSQCCSTGSALSRYERPFPAHAVMTQSGGIFHPYLSHGNREGTCTTLPFSPLLDPTGSYGSLHGASPPAGGKRRGSDRDDLMPPGRSRPETAAPMPWLEESAPEGEMLVPDCFLAVTSPGGHTP